MSDMPPLFDIMWFRLIVGLVVGLSLGSFVTMLSYRLPRRISIVMPRSHCPACKTTLSPSELVPVFSWIAQKGRCRTCGVRMGWHYLLIEIATATAVTAAFVLVGFTFLLLLPIAIIIAAITGLTCLLLK